MSKPVLLVTRRLPPAVEARASRDYDARLNPEDTPRTGADIPGHGRGGKRPCSVARPKSWTAP